MLRTFRYLYVWAEIEFKSALTFGAMGVFNKISNEALGDGDLLGGIIIIVLTANFRQGPVFLEDMWF